MDDARAVRLVERFGDLDRDVQRLVRLQRSPRDPCDERFALQVLHDEVVGPVLVPHVEEGADMRMLKGRDRLGLSLETRFQLGIGGRKNLDGDHAVEPRVARLVDLAEAARAQRGDDVVGAEARAGLHRRSLTEILDVR
jgi:hypothetical protein